MNNVTVTIFLANTVDYGELQNHRRDESVIFSMQTFVVKLASGISAFMASVVLMVFHISADETVDAAIDTGSRVGLRMSMSLIPIAVLLIAVFIFKKHYRLTDEKLSEINKELESRR